jgi:hypothetical protein
MYDKSVNKTIYGAKGDDILLGKIDSTKPYPSEITSYHGLIEQLFPKK